MNGEMVMVGWRKSRQPVGAAIPFLLVLALATPALAQSTCETDMRKIRDKHDVVVASLNTMKKSGKLDAEAACPKLRALTSIENEWVAYMTKNKDWCNIPEDALANMEANKNKTAAFAGQACSVAAKNKKMKEQQADGAGQQQQLKLPAGPL
jgi:hypothetical protein